MNLSPLCQVIICGDEAGCRETASEFGLDHAPNVDRNAFGTPLLSSVFERGRQRARFDRLCYANSDLILFADFLDAIGVVGETWPRWLAVGEATNLDVPGELESVADFDGVYRRALTSGALRGRQWIDFFVFSKDAVGRLPDFAVGRPCWDNWMIWRARGQRIPVVDITRATLVVHQTHAYDHVLDATGERWEGPEADRNRELAGGDEVARFSLDEATHRLTGEGLVENEHGLLHRVGVRLLLHPRAIPSYRVLRKTYRAVRSKYEKVRNALPQT